MTSNELKTEYFIRLSVKESKLLKIIDNLHNVTWKRLSEDSLGNKSIEEKSKINNNIVTFDKYYMQRTIDNTKFLKNIKEFNDIVYDRKIIKIIKNYFNKDPYIKKIEVFHSENNGSQKDEIKKQKWHIDEPQLQIKENKRFVKLFIPLCDVTELNGCTKLIKGSREKLPEGLDLIETRGKRFEDEFIFKHYSKNNLVNMTGKFGEIFLARTDGFHKGGFVKKGFRTMIIVEYNV